MESDCALIKKIKEDNCSESLSELIRRHSALCLNIFQRYSAFFARNIDGWHELIKEKDYLIYRAARSFDESKGAKFNTWLGNHARYECLNALNSRNKMFIPTEDKELQFYIDSQDRDEKTDSNKIDYVFSILGKLKDKRIEKVFSLRYFGPKNISWEKIASEINVSTQTAINLHERGREILNKKLKSEECFDKI